MHECTTKLTGEKQREHYKYCPVSLHQTESSVTDDQ